MYMSIFPNIFMNFSMFYSITECLIKLVFHIQQNTQPSFFATCAARCTLPRPRASCARLAPLQVFAHNRHADRAGPIYSKFGFTRLKIITRTLEADLKLLLSLLLYYYNIITTILLIIIKCGVKLILLIVKFGVKLIATCRDAFSNLLSMFLGSSC